MRKRLIITVSLLTAFCAMTARADEGMWLPSLIGNRIADMQEKGFRLNAEDIYSINQASLKDAVVLFGRGCTGELVSPEGLLLTNHHCGYGQIQQHSSVEHDYLKDGFWAMSREEELPNKGLTVSFLERMEDVTGIILKGYSPEMSESERAGLVKQNSDALIKEVTQEGKGLRARVEALYYGNQYFLFLYREYPDVRLVGAPPSSIGKFGGDTDNWMWPRHTGDFSIFRIYADSDNNPAPYSPDNVPYQPKKYFRISTKGVQEGNFTFIYGFPGRTQEYIHSEGVRYIEETGDPHKIALRTKRLDIMSRHQAESQKVRIQYSSKHAGVANAWKKWQGEVKGIRKMKTVQTKKEYEKGFSKWAVGTEYEGLTDRIAQIYGQLEPYTFATDYYGETIRAVEAAAFASSIAKLYKEADDSLSFDSRKACDLSESFFKDYHLPIDKEIFAAMIQEFDRNMPEAFKPKYHSEMMQKYGNAKAWAEDLFAATMFTDRAAVEALSVAKDQESIGTDRDKVMNDPAVVFFNEYYNWYSKDIRPEAARLNQELQLAYRDYMRGQMEYAEAINGPKALETFYPDANLTLRVAYGHIKGYSPADGVYYTPSSTIKGIMEKDNPEIFDYNIPQRLRDIYATKDYGRWADASGEVPVCFIATNHTTGGNSGSPVINADGDLIGLNFDRVWEGTMSDIVFDPEICRNISLDVRYVLFTIEKIGGASYLFDEMTFTE
ncbi:MAG: S46 family peptidase [Bacteroidales bacterium]|nr:S46 family peptidase [Bacteroidales bacterium]